MSACSAATARRAVLVDEPEPDAERDDDGDDDGVGGVAGEPRDGGGAEQQNEQRVAQLGEQNADRRDLSLVDRVRSDRGEAPGGLGAAQSVRAAVQAIEDLGNGRPAAVTRSRASAGAGAWDGRGGASTPAHYDPTCAWNHPLTLPTAIRTSY